MHKPLHNIRLVVAESARRIDRKLQRVDRKLQVESFKTREETIERIALNLLLLPGRKFGS